MSGKRVAKSTNGAEPFNYEFHPGTPVECLLRIGDAQEPEGVTVWDLDKDTRAPGIRGQLHVIMVENDWNKLSPDDFYFKHYRFKGPPVAFGSRRRVSPWISILLQDEPEVRERPGFLETVLHRKGRR